MRNHTNKHIYIIALVFFISGIGYLTYTSFSENSVYFLNVSEALAMPKESLSAARLFGTVSTDNFILKEHERFVSFTLEDRDSPTETIIVEYTGVIPDTFKTEAEVIVEGCFSPDKTIFQAKTLMTKCPSRYQKENRKPT